MSCKRRTTRSNDDEYANFRLEKGERLNRASCLNFCTRSFETDAGACTDEEEKKTVVNVARKSLCAKLEPEHDTLVNPISVVVRSVPVKMYGNILRHYYVRVEDVLDVHPGTNHRLALAWWHNTTVQENDVHERSLRLCGNCCDQFLDNVWEQSERFNIIWNNCDIMLNRCEQSFVLGLLIVNALWFPLFRDFIGMSVIFACILVYCLVRYRQNQLKFHDRNCDKIYYCPHVRLNTDNDDYDDDDNDSSNDDANSSLSTLI